MSLPFDEEVIFTRESLTYRQQRIQDRIEELEVMLNRVEPTFGEFPLMKRYLEEIEDLRAELEAIEDVMAIEGLPELQRGTA